MQLDENTLDMQLGYSDHGLSARRLWEYTELGQVNVFGQAISARPELNDAATFIDIVRFEGDAYTLDGVTLPDLLHGNEQRVYGDSAYASQKALIRGKAPQAKDFTNQRTRRCGVVDETQRAKNRNKSRIRARVEHVFGVVKRLWGFGKVRYRGLAKNATRAFTALALANIYLGRGQLLGQVRP